MKKLLSFLTVLSLIPIAGSTTISCSNSSQSLKLTNNISKELGLTNEKGEGLVSAEINFNQNKQAQWTISEINNINAITAGRLLENPDKENNATAKSYDAFTFLKNDLKIEPISGKNFTDALFNYTVVSEIKIKLIENSVSPVIKSTLDNKDFFIESGTYKIQFIKGDDILTTPFIEILGLQTKEKNKPLIDPMLKTYQISYDNFNNTPGLKIGMPTTYPENGTDITYYFNNENLTSFFKLINQGNLKIVIEDRKTKEDTWTEGDTLIVKVSVGKIVISNSYNIEIHKSNIENINPYSFKMNLSANNYQNKTYGSLQSYDFNNHSLTFNNMNISPNSTFKYTNSPSYPYNDISRNVIKTDDEVYVQITIANNDSYWTGTSQWLKITIDA